MQPPNLPTTLVRQPAPAWRSTAYANDKEIPISSADYSGRWYVLYWYPLDFTFVCPTEIRGFQSLLAEFTRDGVAVIGASTDSFFSHQAWFADRKTFPEVITHPVIADTNHSVSRAFGVLKEDQGVAFRATVVVGRPGHRALAQRQRPQRGTQPRRSAAHRAGPPERRAVQRRLAQGTGVRRVSA